MAVKAGPPKGVKDWKAYFHTMTDGGDFSVEGSRFVVRFVDDQNLASAKARLPDWVLVHRSMEFIIGPAAIPVYYEKHVPNP